jgi:hypothetical protein
MTEDVDAEQDAAHDQGIRTIADGLCALIANNTASSSPGLDRQIVDLSLAFLFVSAPATKRFAL